MQLLMQAGGDLWACDRTEVPQRHSEQAGPVPAPWPVPGGLGLLLSVSEPKLLELPNNKDPQKAQQS